MDRDRLLTWFFIAACTEGKIMVMEYPQGQEGGVVKGTVTDY